MRKMRKEVKYFRVTNRNAERIAQMFFDSGMRIEEIEEVLGSTVKMVEDGKLVWNVKPVRVIRFRRQ